MALTDNINAYWKLDESSGNASDSVGSNTGTNTSVTFGTGKINNCAIFNGSAKFTMSAHASLQPTSLTINMWVIKTGTGFCTVFQNVYDADTLAGFVFWINNTNLICDYGNDTGTTAGTNYGRINKTATGLTDGNWHMITFTFNDATDTSELYLDASSLGTYTTYTGGIAYNASGTCKIGGDDNGSLNGSIDELGLWSRALSSTEITSLYNSGNGLQYPFASGPANLKSYNTNLKANIKTINTNPIANVKTLNTNA